MNSKQFFKEHYSRLVREGVLKALLCGLIVGFAVNFVAAFATWFMPFNGLWLSISLGILALAISTPLFYFKRFRPTTEMIAKRVDSLGLEERLITMIELQNDESYLAMRQREDAKAKLNEINNKKVKFSLSKVCIVAAAVLAIVGVAMTTVTSLSAKGKIVAGAEALDKILPSDPDTYLSVTYLVEEGGSIEGEADQLVLVGGDATTVIAVEEEGWAFVQWSDEVTDPVRKDLNITDNIEVTAIFQMLEQGDESTEGDPSDGDDEGNDQPNQSQGNDEQNDGDQQSSEANNNAGPGNSAGGSYSENDTVIDGNTYYGDVYEGEGYYDQATDNMSGNEDVPDPTKKYTTGYLDTIK